MRGRATKDERTERARGGRAGEGREDGGRKAAKALVTTSERDTNSYKAAGRPPTAVGGAVPAVGWTPLRRGTVRSRVGALGTGRAPRANRLLGADIWPGGRPGAEPMIDPWSNAVSGSAST